MNCLFPIILIKTSAPSVPLNSHYLLQDRHQQAEREIVNPLNEIHLVGVGAEEHGSDGEGRRVAGHSDVAHVVADRVDVHERSSGGVHIGKGTVRVRTVQDQQIEFTLQ